MTNTNRILRKSYYWLPISQGANSAFETALKWYNHGDIFIECTLLVDPIKELQICMNQQQRASL
jgi:hypothetical protein